MVVGGVMSDGMMRCALRCTGRRDLRCALRCVLLLLLPGRLCAPRRVACDAAQALHGRHECSVGTFRALVALVLGTMALHGSLLNGSHTARRLELPRLLVTALMGLWALASRHFSGPVGALAVAVTALCAASVCSLVLQPRLLHCTSRVVG
jgi:hypothetical protein